MVESDRSAGGRPALPLANATALALLIASGLAHGRLTDRWATSTALVEATARLDRVPRSIGDWQGRDVAIDRRQIERAGILGHVCRGYRNAKDGRELSILLVCGRPGPIAVHTPDVCYRGAGYEAEAGPVDEAIGQAGGPPARFLKARFRKGGAAPEALDILWSWNGRGAWEVPANPRVAFAARPSLYKIYLIARRDGPPSASPGGPAGDWGHAGVILEAVDRALAAPGGPAAGSPAPAGVPSSR